MALVLDGTPEGLARELEALRLELRGHLPAGLVARADLALEHAGRLARVAIAEPVFGVLLANLTRQGGLEA